MLLHFLLYTIVTREARKCVCDYLSRNTLEAASTELIHLFMWSCHKVYMQMRLIACPRNNNQFGNELVYGKIAN